MTTTDWRKLLCWLRAAFPVTAKVVVSRRKIKNNCARTNCELNGRRNMFRVYIDSKQDKSGQIDAILHEWAHIRAIEAAGFGHGESWSRNYGDVYSLWESEYNQ